MSERGVIPHMAAAVFFIPRACDRVLIDSGCTHLCDVGSGTRQVPVSRHTGERAITLLGHSAMGWGAHIREFLNRYEAAAMRLVCTELHETVDGRWRFPRVCV
jgi:hypothetical protein